MSGAAPTPPGRKPICGGSMPDSAWRQTARIAMNEVGNAASRALAVVALMPPAFPKAAINIGESWIREMAIPVGDGSSAPSCPESCYVTFRFDSLTHRRGVGVHLDAGRASPRAHSRADGRSDAGKGSGQRHDAGGSEARMAHRVVVHRS